MAPSNGITSMHPAVAPWRHVQSAKVVRRPPPIGSKNLYSYRYLGKKQTQNRKNIQVTKQETQKQTKQNASRKTRNTNKTKKYKSQSKKQKHTCERMFVDMYVCVSVGLYVCLCVCMYICICLSISLSIFWLCMCVCMYLFEFVCSKWNCDRIRLSSWNAHEGQV